MGKEIFTVGHSTRTIEEFIDLLKTYGITMVADVRTIPKSKFNPQFNSDFLKNKLKKKDIKYFHFEKLGGLRHSKKDSVNLGWKNLSFRGFADYMQTKEFEEGINDLIKFSRKEKIAVMCAEAVSWRCHRSLISDILILHKIKVIHIINRNNFINHKLTRFARVRGKKIIYPR